jgi:hypothetical protein
MSKFITLRTLLFVVGATGTVAVAVDLAMKQGLTALQLIAVGCTALAAFAAKWPGDVSAAEAKERELEVEARVKRESIMPPPSDAARQGLDLRSEASRTLFGGDKP